MRYSLTRPRTPDVACCLALVGLAILLSLRAWTAPVAWDPDGIAYQAKALQYSGVPAREALTKAFSLRSKVTAENGRATLTSEREFAAIEMKEVPRRILVSALAAGLIPILGERSLLAVSIAAYVLLGVALYVLLRFRFTRPFAAGATALTLLFPPLQRWSFAPMTDAWGLLLVVIALIAATLTIRDGRHWLALWVPVVVLGSITRESIAVAVIAAGILAARRVPRAASLLLTGVAALLPAALLLRTSLRFTLVFALAASHRLGVPVDTSLGALIKHWAILAAVEPFWYLHTEPIWSTALLLTLGVAVLARDATLHARVARAAGVGAILCLATFPFISGLRAELVVVPAAAFGIALLAEDVVATTRMWRSTAARADIGDGAAT